MAVAAAPCRKSRGGSPYAPRKARLKSAARGNPQRAAMAADRDVVRGGDRAGVEVRFVQVGADEGPDAMDQRPAPALRWYGVLGVEVVGEQRRHQVEGGGAQPGRVAGPVGAGVGGDAVEQLDEQGAHPFAPGHPAGRERADPVRRPINEVRRARVL
ncbi:hypothetical protein [Kitasatospora sp. NPDC006786]|uniref:hypothetical protein n=1 Tax=unclassified Kitasatospora TaxID=2633591 RepID=UPI0033FF2AAA